jgi:hypothetical protein
VGERRKARLPDLVGLLGAVLWALTIFLRQTPAIHHDTLRFLLGIAPNFGVGLLLPMLLVNFYPVLFKKELSYRLFLYGLGMIFLALFLSEVLHVLLSDSGFDIFDLLTSLVALSIMAWLYRKPNE